MSHKAPAPRNAFVPFRMGQVFGAPGADGLQRAVLWEALRVLTIAREPGALAELPFKWKRGTYTDPLAG